MAHVATRARQAFPDETPIVWECDAASLNFSYVSHRAEELLGYDREDWIEPLFWAERVVHEDDRDTAVSYCLLAAKKRCDHIFEYRARARDGRIVWFRDYVKVIPGRDGTARRLRGAMFDITTAKAADRTRQQLQQMPPVTTLEQVPDFYPVLLA